MIDVAVGLIRVVVSVGDTVVAWPSEPVVTVTTAEVLLVPTLSKLLET